VSVKSTGSIRSITLREVLKRAKSAISRKIRYGLGYGGLNPDAPGPESAEGLCDCSGFVCWCLGFSRKVDDVKYVEFNGGWVNTDAMIQDGKYWGRLFTILDEPKVGCLIVYGSGKGRRYGHVGIVVSVTKGKVEKVIHCSKENERRYGNAVWETDDAVWRGKKTYFLWYKGIVGHKGIVGQKGGVK